MKMWIMSMVVVGCGWEVEEEARMVGISSLSKKALISRQARSKGTLAIIHGLMCWKADAVSRLFVRRKIGGRNFRKIKLELLANQKRDKSSQN